MNMDIVMHLIHYRKLFTAALPLLPSLARMALARASDATHAAQVDDKSPDAVNGYLKISFSITEQKMRRLLLLAFISMPVTSAIACATCGCSLSSDAATGYASSAGWRLNLEYNYIDQNQLRSGTRAVSRSSAAAINDAGDNQEVERDTINRYTTLSLIYAPNSIWNFRLAVPYIDRSHATYGSATNPITPDQLSSASVGGIGDIKLIGSYQGFLPTHNLGVQLGVKLPTGNYGGANASGTGIVGHEPTAFSTGPLAQNPPPDNLLDASLQAGTGSTDLILGAYYFQPVSQDFDAFASAQFQTAVRHKLDQFGQDFRPGNLSTFTVGLRYEERPNITPQIQLNLSRKAHDQGALADRPNTAGTAVYLSPGVTMSVLSHLQVYGFVQLPVYSNLQGYQVFPRWTATVGASYAF